MITRRSLACAVLSALLAAAPAPAQRTPPSTAQHLRNAAVAGIEGNRFVAAGRYADALDRYTAGVNHTDRGLDDYTRHGIGFHARPPVAYWLAARSHFDAARMQVHLRRSPADADHHLVRGRQAADAVLILDSVQASRVRQRFTADTWKYLFLRGQINLLRGDLPRARADYEQVARLNPGFVPAGETLSFITYAESRGMRGTTPQGLTLPPKPAPRLSTGQLLDIGLQFLGLISTKYSAEIEFARTVSQAMFQ
jgi:tetratricopeptide (TPR) repeat protein